MLTFSDKKVGNFSGKKVGRCTNGYRIQNKRAEVEMNKALRMFILIELL